MNQEVTQLNIIKSNLREIKNNIKILKDYLIDQSQQIDMDICIKKINNLQLRISRLQKIIGVQPEQITKTICIAEQQSKQVREFCNSNIKIKCNKHNKQICLQKLKDQLIEQIQQLTDFKL